MHKGSNPTARATNPTTGGPPDPIPKGRPDPKTGGRPDPRTGGRPPKKWRETGPKPAVRAVAKNCGAELWQASSWDKCRRMVIELVSS